MKSEELTLTNFNGRAFRLRTYCAEVNPNLVTPQRPLIIVVPGGSFNHLAQREGEPVALAYLSHGYNAAVMDYNLVQEPGNIYPDAALDLLTTVRYFRQHASAYQLDPQQIVTAGFSAGGHVVSAANILANMPKLAKRFGYVSDQVRPNATILGYPLINIEKVGFIIPEDQKGKYPAEVELLDTAKGVTPKHPVTFLFQAWDDPIVLITNSLEYLAALQAKQVSCEAHLFAHGGHGFSLARPELDTEGCAWQNNPHASHWFKLSLEWLDQQLGH